MRTLTEIVNDIKAQGEIVSHSVKNDDPRLESLMQGRKRDAEEVIAKLSTEFLNAFPSKAEIILVDGDGVQASIDEFKDFGVITVDAEGFYKHAEESVNAVSYGSNSTAMNMAGFVELVRSLEGLARAAQVRLPRPLEYDAGNAQLSVVENLRNIVRSQFGRSGAESVWVKLKAGSTALTNLVDKEPVPVVVYNIAGATTDDYKDVFTSVHQVTLEKGDKAEVMKTLKSIQSELKKQGKLTKTNKKETEQTENKQE
jgi:hypothetical protein